MGYTDYIKFPNKAFIISMDGQGKRWQKAYKAVRTAGWDEVYKIPGVDAKTFNFQDKFDQSGSLWKAFSLTHGQLGCALAHLKAWKTFLKTKPLPEETVAIFEDDVLLPARAIHELKDKWAYVPSDMDLLLLGCSFGCFPNRNFMERYIVLLGYPGYQRGHPRDAHAPMINDYIHVPSMVRGAQSYVITARGAGKMIEALEGHITGHVDQLMDTIPRLSIYAWTKSFGEQLAQNEDSNTATVKAPRVINKVLDKVLLQDGVTLSYGLTVPVFQVAGYYVNGYTIIFFLWGLVVGVILKNKGLVLGSALVIFILYALDLTSVENAIQFVGSMIVFLLPYMLFNLRSMRSVA